MASPQEQQAAEQEKKAIAAGKERSKLIASSIASSGGIGGSGIAVSGYSGATNVVLPPPEKTGISLGLAQPSVSSSDGVYYTSNPNFRPQSDPRATVIVIDSSGVATGRVAIAGGKFQEVTSLKGVNVKGRQQQIALNVKQEIRKAEVRSLQKTGLRERTIAEEKVLIPKKTLKETSSSDKVSIGGKGFGWTPTSMFPTLEQKERIPETQRFDSTMFMEQVLIDTNQVTKPDYIEFKWTTRETPQYIKEIKFVNDEDKLSYKGSKLFYEASQDKNIAVKGLKVSAGVGLGVTAGFLDFGRSVVENPIKSTVSLAAIGGTIYLGGAGLAILSGGSLSVGAGTAIVGGGLLTYETGKVIKEKGVGGIPRFVGQILPAAAIFEGGLRIGRASTVKGYEKYANIRDIRREAMVEKVPYEVPSLRLTEKRLIELSPNIFQTQLFAKEINLQRIKQEQNIKFLQELSQQRTAEPFLRERGLSETQIEKFLREESIARDTAREELYKQGKGIVLDPFTKAVTEPTQLKIAFGYEFKRMASVLPRFETKKVPYEVPTKKYMAIESLDGVFEISKVSDKRMIDIDLFSTIKTQKISSSKNVDSSIQARINIAKPLSSSSAKSLQIQEFQTQLFTKDIDIMGLAKKQKIEELSAIARQRTAEPFLRERGLSETQIEKFLREESIARDTAREGLARLNVPKTQIISQEPLFKAMVEPTQARLTSSFKFPEPITPEQRLKLQIAQTEWAKGQIQDITNPEVKIKGTDYPFEYLRTKKQTPLTQFEFQKPSKISSPNLKIEQDLIMFGDVKVSKRSIYQEKLFIEPITEPVTIIRRPELPKTIQEPVTIRRPELPKTIQEPITKTKLNAFTFPSLSIEPVTIIRQNIKLGNEPIQDSFLRQQVKIEQEAIQRPKIIQEPITITKVDMTPITIQEPITETIIENIFNIEDPIVPQPSDDIWTPPPKKPLPEEKLPMFPSFFFTDEEFIKRTKRSKKQSPKFKEMISPSIEAVVFNIRGSPLPKEIARGGFGVRPLQNQAIFNI